MPNEEKRYLVSWEIDIWADSPQEAAKQAALIVSESALASVYAVKEVNDFGVSCDKEILVDLLLGDENE